jgi:hypothetical protein
MQLLARKAGGRVIVTGLLPATMDRQVVIAHEPLGSPYTRVPAGPCRKHVRTANRPSGVVLRPAQATRRPSQPPRLLVHSISARPDASRRWENPWLTNARMRSALSTASVGGAPDRKASSVTTISPAPRTASRQATRRGFAARRGTQRSPAQGSRTQRRGGRAACQRSAFGAPGFCVVTTSSNTASSNRRDRSCRSAVSRWRSSTLI